MVKYASTWTQCYYDIAYSFLVGGDGRIYEGRGWGKVGAHTKCYNGVSYAVSFIGNFVNKMPTECMIEAYEKFQKVGVDILKSYIHAILPWEH